VSAAAPPRGGPHADPAVDPRHDALVARSGEATRAAALRAAVIAAVVLASLAFTGLLDRDRLLDGLPALGQIASEMMPPDFTRWREWLRPLLDTLAMSIAGTALAVAAAVPLALLAASNTTPHPALQQAVRLLLNFVRSVPELILGILFVAAVGFGALPGVLALALHSIGMVGKFFAESIEHVDPKPIEAARAAGGSPVQVIWHAVLPQVLPQMADTTVYRWEYNFRASTVMGAVGAGGIGTELIGALRLMDYPQVGAILLAILACVTVVDAIGQRVRRGLA
jgi:phosphonate transport system permease protein